MVLKHIGVAIVGLACAWSSSMAVAQSPQTYRAFVVSPDGQEVTDARTGLVWRRCAEGLRWDSNGCSGMAATYNYSDAQNRSRQAMALTGQPASTHQASNNLGEPAGGASDWRLPTVHELSTIIDRSYQNPTTDGAAFPNTPPGWFWSSTFDTTNPSYIWIISFYNGYANNIGPYNKGHVRLVRGTVQTASSGAMPKTP